MDDQTSGMALPGYRDFVPIARSQGSEVYRAHQDGVDRPVAVKVLLLDDAEAIARFERELEITVQLGRQHPHIVNVIDTGTTPDGRPCIVMEHYDGGSLHDRLRAGGPLPWGEVLAAGTVVADALSFAHRHGVLHRDVKPQNILVLPTSYVVADFGIARRIDAARTASVEWFSFRHAAPQVLDGEPPAVADDVWSLGSTMFTLLDGLPPFATGDAGEDTALAYMRRVRTGRPRALSRRDVPAGLAAVIDRCLRHERADRFPDAAALHAALRDLAAETRAWAPPDAAPAPGTGTPAPMGSRGDTTSGLDSRFAGRRAGGPPVVPVHPSTMVPQPAPSLPAPAMPPPAAARPSMPQPARPGPSGSPPPQATAPRTVSGVDGATVKGPTAGASPASLAQAVASAVAAGGYVAEETTTGYTGPTPAATARPNYAGRILVGAVIALVVGGVLGIGGTWVARLAREGAPEAAGKPTAQAPAAAPTTPGQSPTTPPANVNNTRIAPTISGLDRDGTSVLVRWRDPSKGQAQFIVVLVRDGRGEPVRQAPAGTTQILVEGLDGGAAPHCFLVIAVLGKERGLSPTRCTDG
jgi:serine/threonine protein kinase